MFSLLLTAVLLLSSTRLLGDDLWSSLAWCALVVTALVCTFSAAVHGMLELNRERVLNIRKGEKWNER